jgi:signal transduction histidine kinase
LSGSNDAAPRREVATISQAKPLTGIDRRFSNLRVRPKLMLLHNLFFLVLALAVYFSLIPMIEERLATARTREVSLIWNRFSTVTPESGEEELRIYDISSGTGSEFGLTDAAQSWMLRFPGRVWRRDDTSDTLYKLVPGSDSRFYRLTLPLEFYGEILSSIRIVMFAVLGVCYVLAVLLLELVIMPKHVYQPLNLFLAADAATRRGDRHAEIVPETLIPGDEIGQIMRSRNDTVEALHMQEDVLEEALRRLESTATDLRAKNEQLETAKQSLEAQDRLASLGLLSAGVAHEMNTPLAVLHGSIEKLLETVCEPGAQARLQRMIRVTERLRKISTGLLDFSRVRSQESVEVLVRPLIEEAWHLVAIDEKAGEVDFENNIDASAAVMANADRLVQVFVNLLRNAVNAVPPGGLVRVSAVPASLGARRALAIRVEDNGPGIPPEVLPEIFEAFVTTRLDDRGTGLGLAVAEGIVHQHGGTITATNCASGGARLEVTLPAARGQASEEFKA